MQTADGLESSQEGWHMLGVKRIGLAIASVCMLLLAAYIGSLLDKFDSGGFDTSDDPGLGGAAIACVLALVLGIVGLFQSFRDGTEALAPMRAAKPPTEGARDEETTAAEYVGLGKRFVAFLIDCILVGVIISFVLGTAGLEQSMMDGDAMTWAINVVPIVATVLFWRYLGATPGKMVFSAKIVDAKTGGQPSTAQFIIRYLGYIVSTLPLGFGFLWIAIDGRKQGFHDKLAGTVVVRQERKKSQSNDR